MQIFNQTKNVLLTENAKEVEGILPSTLGLIGKKRPQSIVVRTRFGIHTFGLRFPIDVIVLNSKNEVIRQKEHLYPLKVFFWNPKYNLVLELPDGILKRTRTTLGDKLTFI